MRTLGTLALLTCGVLSLSGCPLIMALGYPSYDDPDPDAPFTLPPAPRPVGGVNTVWDDYNSAPPPTLVRKAPLYFSTNRATQGGTFDVIGCELWLRYNADYPGMVDLDGHTANAQPLPLAPVNGPQNELGPYRLRLPKVAEEVVLFASDRGGDLDVYFVDPADHTAKRATALCSPKDDGYPSFDLARGRVYWCSNRAGTFDVYTAPFHTLADLICDDLQVTKLEAVCSPADDKCPFVLGERMLLVSNRDGGQGGFDIYTSSYDPKRKTWSQPENLKACNTPQDEYRPVRIHLGKPFTNDLLLFSSNRPKGMGGFDLYWAGIAR